jgi:hypothetical protein
MNRAVLAGIASIVVLAIIAFAIASASDDDEDTAVVPTATPPAASPTPQPSLTPPAQPSPQPTPRPDQPVSATPGAPQPSPTVIIVAPSGRHPELAPIDGLDVLTLESFPPQYMLHVRAGLPSGCAQPLSNRIVGRQGNVIQVEVLNSLPDNAICTAIYGNYDLNINLGSDFTSGQTYKVQVNDKEVTFKAQ